MAHCQLFQEVFPLSRLDGDGGNPAPWKKDCTNRFEILSDSSKAAENLADINHPAGIGCISFLRGQFLHPLPPKRRGVVDTSKSGRSPKPHRVDRFWGATSRNVVSNPKRMRKHKGPVSVQVSKRNDWISPNLPAFQLPLLELFPSSPGISAPFSQ